MSDNKKPVVVTVSTYPPYEDGISTFTYDLAEAEKLLFPEIDFKIAAVDIDDANPSDYPREVGWMVRKNEEGDYSKIAGQINSDEDVKAVELQHEYGLFGRDMGEWSGNFILDFTDNLKKPLAIVMHSVLSNPPPEVKEVTDRLVVRADVLIVMSEHSSAVLQEFYGVPAQKIKVIHHGIHPIIFEYPEQTKKREGLQEKFILSTFGFLGPNKGIEYVIESLPEVISKYPNTEYWIIGRTHPMIQQKIGEKYREKLESLVSKLNLGGNIKFFNRYQSVPELLKFLSLTDVYIATSLNPDQVVSGTFSYALGNGRCVVSTAFSQARELIVRKNMGLIVDFRKPQEFSRAILELFGHPRARHRMQLRAYKNTRDMLWTNCAYSYCKILSDLDQSDSIQNHFLPEINLSHFKNMTDNFGMVQFSKGKIPDKSSGYTLDDNARALIYCVMDLKENPGFAPEIQKFLNFILHCQREDGLFENDLTKDREINRARHLVFSEDAEGRALWAMNVLQASQEIAPDLKKEAAKAVKKFEGSNFEFNFPRAQAFRLLGLSALSRDQKYPPEIIWRRMVRYADSLVALFHENANDEWQWFEKKMSYANGILPAALLQSFRIINRPEYREIGLRSLEFLIKNSFDGQIYAPVGQRGWFNRNRNKAVFDQQPEEAMAMIVALAAAYRSTSDQRFLELAQRAFFWFLGNNILGVSLYDNGNGGCFDGLTKRGVNPNQGAESLLSYLISRALLSRLKKTEGQIGS